MEVFILPIIKKITVQKRNTDRYNVFFDDGKEGQYAFSVSEDILIKYDLRKGKELDEQQLAEIFYNEEIQKAYIQAVHYLSFRMRSIKEVKEHLQEKGYEENVIQEVIGRLLNQKYLDDREFALAFVKTQINTSDKGPNVIKEGLRKKGIHPSIIDESLALFTNEEKLEKAVKLCEKQMLKNKTVSTKQLSSHLSIFLVRKGFEQVTIQKAVALALENVPDHRDEETIQIQGEKALKKYRLVPPEKRIMKVKQFLYRKGFQLADIEKFLDGIDINNHN